MDWVTTSTIIDRLRTGNDQGAWSGFVERFRRPVIAFAHGLGLSETQAEDAAQETLMAFATQLRAGAYQRERGRLSSWLFGIAYRQAMAARRKGAVERARVMEAADGAGGDVAEGAASMVWDREWERRVLEECLQQARSEVEPKTFAAFELAVQTGISAEAAAEQLGLTAKQVYNAKHRILKRLRELREQYEDLV
jgi:RNA polymerase sigma-70 factor (ECF subfamily)